MRLPRPNFTQTPNIIFDEVLPTLKEGEMRVLLVIIRQTFGWGNKDWDRISLSQLSEKTGMGRKSVCRSLVSLIKKGLVEKRKEGKNGDQKCWYRLVTEEPENFKSSHEDSNNSYQCPKDTPPSVLKTPTKETLTKEKESPKYIKPPFFEEFGKFVKLKKEDLLALKSEFGDANVESKIESMNDYIEATGKKYKNYYAALRIWLKKETKSSKEKESIADQCRRWVYETKQDNPGMFDHCLTTAKWVVNKKNNKEIPLDGFASVEAFEKAFDQIFGVK